MRSGMSAHVPSCDRDTPDHCVERVPPGNAAADDEPIDAAVDIAGRPECVRQEMLPRVISSALARDGALSASGECSGSDPRTAALASVSVRTSIRIKAMVVRVAYAGVRECTLAAVSAVPMMNSVAARCHHSLEEPRFAQRRSRVYETSRARPYEKSLCAYLCQVSAQTPLHSTCLCERAYGCAP